MAQMWAKYKQFISNVINEPFHWLNASRPTCNTIKCCMGVEKWQCVSLGVLTQEPIDHTLREKHRVASLHGRMLQPDVDQI